MKPFGVGLSFSEMISDCGIFYGNAETYTYLATAKTDRPVGLQLFGSNAEISAKAISIIENKADYDLLDINFGCPVYKVTKTGAGSAWLKHPQELYAYMSVYTNDVDTLREAMSRSWPMIVSGAVTVVAVAVAMVTINELEEEKMILRGANSATRQLFEASLHSQGLSLDNLNIILEADNIGTIKELVIKNIGVSVLARSTCLDEEMDHKIVLLPIEGLAMIREVNLVYPKDFGHTEILDGIVGAYKQTAHKH